MIDEKERFRVRCLPGVAVIAVLLAVWCAASAVAQTSISTVSASPSAFYADENQTTTLTAEGTPGVANLVMRVTRADRVTVVRSSIALTETSPGVYTCVWNGRNNSNQLVDTGVYSFRVYNLATSSYIGPWGDVEVVSRKPRFISAEVTPSIFVPDGTNANVVQIRIQATPLESGSYRWGIYNNWLGWMVYRENLPSPSSPGVYEVSWNGVSRHSYSGFMGSNYGGYGEDHSYNTSYVVLWAPDGTQLSSPAGAYFKVRGVWALNRSRSEIEPRSGEFATFTAVGYDGLNLLVRITRSSGGALVGEFPMNPVGNGQYVFSWNGRNASGEIQPTGLYNLQVVNAVSGVPYYGATSSLRLRYTVDAISVAPDPFSPDGTGAPGRTATITVNAAPGQTGLKYGIYNNWLGWMVYQDTLRETGTPGVYQASWDGVSRNSYNGYMGNTYSGYGEDHSYNRCDVVVWDANGEESIVRGYFKVRGIDRLERDKSSFAAVTGSVTFTARGYSGFNVRIRIYRNSPSTLVRTALMSDNGDGSYTFVWDGTDDGGQAVAPGAYTAYVYNADSDRPYQPSAGVNITFSVTAISVDPDPFSPDGTASRLATITVQAPPGLTGLKYGIHNNWLGWMVYREPLQETATPGVYQVTWNGVSRNSYNGYMGSTYSGYGEDHSYNRCEVVVWDASNVESQVRGYFKVRGIDRLERSVGEFNPRKGGTVTFTARGYPGFSVRIRVYRNSPSTLVRTALMTDNGDGTYTFIWDGKNDSGEFANPGSYTAYVYNAASDVPYVPTAGVNLQFDVESISVDRDPFTPNGTPEDVVTVTVNAAPGQSLQYYIYHEWLGTSFNWTALTEVSPGVYRGTWDGVQRTSYEGYIPAHPIYRAIVRVRNADGVQAQTSKYFSVRGAHGVSATPAQFTPGGGNVLNITVPGEPGLQIDAVVSNLATGVVTRRIQLIEAGGSYTGAWDGKDEYGNFAGAGNYRIQPYARARQKPYYYWNDITVRPAVFSVEASPDPFAPTGANSVTITLRADPGQAGLYARIFAPSGSYAQVTFSEVGSEGTYVSQWDGRIGGDLAGAGVYTIRVYTAGGVQFPQTGSLTVASVTGLVLSPNPFEPGGGRMLTVTAQVGGGVSLDLEARIGTLKTLPLSPDGSGGFTAVWNGEVSPGVFIQAGQHTVHLYNSVTGQRYTPTATLNVVDTTPPAVFITGGPSEGSTVPGNVTFVWSGSDNLTPVPQIVFSYRMDDGAWSAFSGATTAAFSLPDGPHTFSVRARDLAGNISQPVERRFTVAVATLTLTKSASVSTAARGDVITYTLTCSNNSPAVALGVRVTDPIPAGTLYVAGSTRLDGSPVPDQGSVAAVAAGVHVGALAPGARAVITFDVTVAAVPNGTVISNTAQATGANLASSATSNTVQTTVETPDVFDPDTTITGGPGDGARLCEGSAVFRFTGSDDTAHVSQLQYRWRLDGGEWSAFDSATERAFTGLAHGSHTFEVAARDPSGKVDQTPAIRTFTVDLNPPVISGVSAAAGQSDFAITWTTDEPATSRVEYGTSDALGSSTPLSAALRTSHSVTVTGLEPDRVYHFRVRSTDACGRESVSAVSTVRTLADTGLPDTSLTQAPGEGSTVCSSSVNLCWSGSDNTTPVSQLRYSWRLDGGVWSDPSPDTCHQFTGLSAGSHTFSVRAHDAAGNVDPTPASRTFVVSLEAPVITNVTASAQPAQATITWLTDRPSTSRVEYGTSPSLGSASPAIGGQRTGHSVTITGLSPDTLYYYRVVSRDACERQSESAVASFRTPADEDVPNTWFTSGPVEGGKACSPDPQFCWTGSDNVTPANQLQFSWRLDGGDWSAWSGQTCAQLTGLAEGPHVLSVKARDTSGNEDATPAVRNFRVDTVAPTIANVSVSPRATSVIVSWVTSEPCTSQVQYGPTAEYGQSTYVDTSPKTAHRMTITGLSPSTTYHFRVISSDGCQTVMSDDATVTTSEVRPPNLLIQSLNAPVSVAAQQDFAVTWTVKNQAFGDAAGPWKDRVYLSADETLGEGDTLLVDLTVPSGLAAPFSYTQTQSARLPIVAPGVYYLIVKTDAEDAVTELVEEDNTVAQPIVVALAQQLVAAPDPIPLNLHPTVPVTGQISLSNLGVTDLSGLSVRVTGAPSSVSIQFTGVPPALGALTGATVGYSVLASDESTLRASPEAVFETAEGRTATVRFDLKIIPRQPRLVVNPGYLETGMLRGRQTIVECEVMNQGGVPATGLQVLVPSAPWLSLLSPSSIGTLAPGEKATVSLALRPPADLPLGPYNGAIAINGSNAGVQVNFRFMAVSDQTGGLKIYCNDEFTYFADGSPRVNNATVIVRNSITGEKVFEEVSGESGIVLRENLTEGYYDVEVRAERHGTFRQPVMVEAGRLTEVIAFLPRQLVTYTWTVEQVEIQDRYKISIEAVFETHVPAPVVTVDPPYAFVPVFEGETSVVEFTITNHGLIAALGTQINFGQHPDYFIVPLIRDIGMLPPQSSIVVPVLYRRRTDGWPPGVPQVASLSGAAASPASLQPEGLAVQGAWDEPCDVSIKGEVIYYYVCDGNRWRRESIDTTIFDIAKKIWDAVSCGFNVVACGSGIVNGVGLAKCPDAIRCLFNYACESLSALTGAPCCICKMTSAILGDTGSLLDAAKCLPVPAPPLSGGTPGGGPGGGYVPGGGYGPGFNPFIGGGWGINLSGSPCGPLPSGGSSQPQTSASVIGPAKDSRTKDRPADNGDAVIRKYGGKVIRTRVDVF